MASNSTEEFIAGESYKPELVPYDVSPALAASLANYPNLTGFKAVVLTQEGNGFARSLADATTQEEASQVLLERCQLEFRQMCALFAEGNVIKYNASEFYTKHVSAISNVTVFDPMKIPGLLTRWKLNYARDYPSQTVTFNAIALGQNGLVQKGWSQVTQADANRRSIEFCEAMGNRPCTLYAEGTSVVFDIDTYQWSPPLVDYGPKALVINRIPFISDRVREVSAMPMYQRMLNTNVRSVVAISRYGHWYHRESNSNITQADRDLVLERCNALRELNSDPTAYQHRCFIYSENMQVVMTRAIFEEFALGRTN